MLSLVVRSDSERGIIEIGKSLLKDEAKIILQNDFKKILYKKVGKTDATFEEIYELGENIEWNLSEEKAWLDDCQNVDYDWSIITVEDEKDVLQEPMTIKEMIRATSEDNQRVKGKISVNIHKIIHSDFEEFLDLISMKLVGSDLLSNIQYELVDMGSKEDETVIIEVEGDVYNIMELDDEMFEELKTELFKSGTEALEDFTDMDLSKYDDKDTIDNILNEIATQMPMEEQVNFYRKYVK